MEKSLGLKNILKVLQSNKSWILFFHFNTWNLIFFIGYYVSKLYQVDILSE